MKKSLVIITALVAVAIASFLWIRSQLGIADAARLVPPDAVAFVCFPDLPRSAMRWPQTTLARIGAEPAMAEFLEKPISHVTGEKAGQDAAEVLISLKPGRVFGVLTSVESGQLSAVIGFQYWGSSEDFDGAMERLRLAIYQGSVPEATTSLHEGAAVVSTPLADKALYTSTLGRWGFLSNDMDALSSVMDLAAGREDTESLATETVYLDVVGRLPSEPDLLVFLRPSPMLDALLAVGEELGAIPDDKQVEQIRKAQAVGFAGKMDGLDLTDALFILNPSEPASRVLTHHGMQFTSPQSLAYFDFLLRFEDLNSLLAHPSLAAALPPQAGSASPYLARMSEVLEGEMSLSLSWPEGTMRPEAMVVLPLRDAEAAETLLMEAVRLLPETTISEKDGIRYFGFPSLRSPFLDPTLAIGEDSLLVGLDPLQLEQVLANGSAAQTLRESPAFAPALSAFESATESFGYIDSRGIFERSYPMLRQVIVFGAALMPGASDFVDATKLPETQAIAKHLTPILYSQTRLPEGILIESSGPISMNQALVAGAGIGAVFYGPRLLGP